MDAVLQFKYFQDGRHPPSSFYRNQISTTSRALEAHFFLGDLGAKFGEYISIRRRNILWQQNSKWRPLRVLVLRARLFDQNRKRTTSVCDSHQKVAPVEPKLIRKNLSKSSKANQSLHFRDGRLALFCILQEVDFNHATIYEYDFPWTS